MQITSGDWSTECRFLAGVFHTKTYYVFLWTKKRKKGDHKEMINNLISASSSLSCRSPHRRRRHHHLHQKQRQRQQQQQHQQQQLPVFSIYYFFF